MAFKPFNLFKNPFKPTLNQVLAFVVTILSIGAIFWAFKTFHINRYIEVLELKTYDLRASNQLIPSDDRPSEDIIILAFDDLTLNTYGDEFGTWPWPREIHGEMIQFLNDVAGVKAIAYDLMFSTPQKKMEDSDKKLTDAFNTYDNVYVSMNFDHNADVMTQIGKYDTHDLEHLKPLRLNLKIDNSHHSFFKGTNLNFEHYRALLPEIMAAERNIGFVNHETDIDGTSRGNPLIYNFKTEAPIRSENLPLQEIKSKKGDILFWQDSAKNPVNQFGYLLNDSGQIKKENYQGYYPYLSLRLFLDLTYGKNQPPITLTSNHTLKLQDKEIPLLPNGMFLINWYHVDLQKEIVKTLIKQSEQRMAEISAESELSPEEKQRHLAPIRAELTRFKKIVDRPFKSNPYNIVSSWEVLKAMKNKTAGTLDDRDKNLLTYLKNKIVFVGATAVATYDTKYTPLNPLGTQGIIIPITIFDNLRQGSHFMKRASNQVNLLVTVILCVLCAIAAIRFRSATAGMLTVFTLSILYTVVATVIFKQFNLWINLAMPLVAVMVTTLLTFMLKYISRDQDYEKTYIMATTDSMTGLYNHRFFQEHMQKSIERSERFGQKFSLVLIDIDFFKKFNDNYGHQAGDEVLRCVAQKLKDSVRTIDVVARYGGEEMAVILDRANEEEALAVGEKLVKEVAAEAYPISDGVSKHVTISVGVATYPTHGTTNTELIEFSDQGLYRAKENGRNQVGAQYDDGDAPEKKEPESTPESNEQTHEG